MYKVIIEKFNDDLTNVITRSENIESISLLENAISKDRNVISYKIVPISQVNNIDVYRVFNAIEAPEGVWLKYMAVPFVPIFNNYSSIIGNAIDDKDITSAIWLCKYKMETLDVISEAYTFNELLEITSIAFNLKNKIIEIRKQHS